ncbi:hypothetical protein GDO78_015933 [Eleutherodactylus coqui]|uniref:TNFR-Cys domain-containing protein n=1 Tax=Eleutherodactylus coqui TaxID=57060 RepID=A0A8J6EL45_ELECQ|nr:hypothetical protein GDO78_015933 [Eleutherodactylus coqui]
MTGLFLVISLFWLLPAICHTLDIPLQSALLIKGEPVGFTKTPYRQKRSETENGSCNEHDYKPKRANHCCNKCLAGYRVQADCTQEGMKTNCTRCPPDHYNTSPSSSKSCRECTDCLSQLGQVKLQACSPINDTVCGCPGGFYKSDNDRKFTCLQCNMCDNGSILSPCKADKDTLCKCFHNFYLDSTGNCRSCKECNRTEDCDVHCPPLSKSPEEPDIVPRILVGVMGVALLAVVIAVIVKSRRRLFSSFQTRSPLPATDVTENGQLNTPLDKWMSWKKVLCSGSLSISQSRDPPIKSISFIGELGNVA